MKTNYVSYQSESFDPSYAAKSSIPCMDEVGACPVTNDVRIIKDIKELCQGLTLSEKARALRYDKIVEVLKGGNNSDST